jgi:hypothetical protein
VATAAIQETLALGDIRAIAAPLVKMAPMGVGVPVVFVVGPVQLVSLGARDLQERMGSQACKALLDLPDVCSPTALLTPRYISLPEPPVSAPGAPGMRGSPGRRGPRGANGKPGSFLPSQGRLGNLEFSLPASVSWRLHQHGSARAHRHTCIGYGCSQK